MPRNYVFSCRSFDYVQLNRRFLPYALQTEVQPKASLGRIKFDADSGFDGRWSDESTFENEDDAEWDRSCSPTPWLLPPDTQLPYSEYYNDLERLADVQARSIDGYRAVSVVFFNYHQSVMMQNAVYSMTKWSGVCNYIVAVWDEPSLDVCRSMNLPCFNATGLTPGGDTIGADKEAKLHSPDYVKITWMKPILVSHLVHLGFVVHATDVDIAYAPADLTRSYLQFILQGNATAAFQRESKFPFVVNTGNYMILPNQQGKAFMKAWLSRADAAIAAGHHEQTALGELYHEQKNDAFLICSSPQECAEAAEIAAKKVAPSVTPIVRRTANSWFIAFGNTCITKSPHLMSAVHPCAFPQLYFHSVCVIGSAAKTSALKGVGFWFLDDGEGVGGTGCPADDDNVNVVRCRPLSERISEVEKDFLQCDASRLVFNYHQTTTTAMTTAITPAPSAMSTTTTATGNQPVIESISSSNAEKADNNATPTTTTTSPAKKQAADELQKP